MAATTSSSSSSRTAAATRPGRISRRSPRRPWGRRQFRWVHEDDAHELRCTNSGFAAARGTLLMAWQDDMFLRASWFVPELIRTFAAYPDIGMLSASRGLLLPPARRADRHVGAPDRLAPAAEHDRSGAGKLVPAAGSRRRHPPVDRAEGVSRACRIARRSVPADGVGRGGSRVPHPRGRLARGDLRIRAARRLLPSWKHHDLPCAVRRRTGRASSRTAGCFTRDGITRLRRSTRGPGARGGAGRRRRDGP